MLVKNWGFKRKWIVMEDKQEVTYMIWGKHHHSVEGLEKINVSVLIYTK